MPEHLTEAQHRMMRTPIGRAQETAEKAKRRPKPPKTLIALDALLLRHLREFYAREAARRAAA